VSNRLLEELKALGLSASAEVNERLAPRLAMKVKAPTLLRYLRRIPAPPDAHFLFAFIQLSVFYSKQTLFSKCEEEPE
jgi:hypothetical protein